MSRQLNEKMQKCCWFEISISDFGRNQQIALFSLKIKNVTLIVRFVWVEHQQQVTPPTYHSMCVCPSLLRF